MRLSAVKLRCLSWPAAESTRRSRTARQPVIIVWGDYGWQFGDMGVGGKATNYEIATRVPLMIWTPDMTTCGARGESISIGDNTSSANAFCIKPDSASPPMPMPPRPGFGPQIMFEMPQIGCVLSHTYAAALFELDHDETRSNGTLAAGLCFSTVRHHTKLGRVL